MSEATDWRRQLDALSQQYWNAFNSVAAGKSPAGAATWPAGAGAWPPSAGAPAADVHEAIGRFGNQAQQYLDLMQGMAQRVQSGANAADLTAWWRDALAAHGGGNPMLEALASLNGPGVRGVQQLADGAEALLAPVRKQMDALLSLPAFGQGREGQERVQQLAREQIALQQASNRYSALLMEASQDAFARFEKKLAERGEPGRQLDSARALYDLWIDAAEEAYAEIALSPRFQEVYGELINAKMRVRRSVQQQVERSCAELGMPTRSELDSAHKRVHELQRELRDVLARVAALETGGATSAPRPATAKRRDAAAPARKARAAAAGTSASSERGPGKATPTTTRNAPKAASRAAAKPRKTAGKAAAKGKRQAAKPPSPAAARNTRGSAAGASNTLTPRAPARRSSAKSARTRAMQKNSGSTAARKSQR